MNFDRQTRNIVSFQRVPGPAQLAIPRIGVGDVLEEINGSSTGTRNHRKRGSTEWKKDVLRLDEFILTNNHPVSLTFRDKRFGLDTFHSNHGSNHIDTDSHLSNEWWSVEARLQLLAQTLRTRVTGIDKIMLAASNSALGYRRVAEHYSTSIQLASDTLAICLNRSVASYLAMFQSAVKKSKSYNKLETLVIQRADHVELLKKIQKSKLKPKLEEQVEEEGTEAQTAKQSTQTSLSSVFNAFKESTRSGNSWDVDGTVQVTIVSGNNLKACDVSGDHITGFVS